MIHQYKLSGYNIVLDVYSGSVHAVDDVAYDAIALIDQGLTREAATAQLEQKYRDRADVTPADISDCFDDIEELTAAGQLFAPDAYADHAFDFKNRSNVVKALCLHVAHTCNLNCSYCFAAQGKFHGEAGLMSFETGKRALDFLIEHSGTRRNLEVDFFGGEPLMNFEVCKQLVAYARSIEKEHNKNFRFTMTTNGIGITDEVIDFCAQSRAFMPHFHIPLQSGSDEVLRLMHRHYDTRLFADKVAHVRQAMPDAFIGVDVIVGTRGETDELFAQALQFMEEIDVSQYHVFSYSERPGTRALQIPHVVSPEQKHERSQQVLALSERKWRQFYDRFRHTTRPVLLEHSRHEGLMHGFTDNYIRVSVSAKDMDNQIASVRLGDWDADGNALQGTLL